LGNATRDGSVIFGKNSDREPNEAHEVVIFPHMVHPKNAVAQCTYIDIPQVRETNAVLLSKPFWIWGAEMGANEHGVVIGNEALFTKVPYGKQPGLIGMDFLRLALERASSADEALDVMIELLETYGQGGNCGFTHEMYYHNGFLIADFEKAWVFETAGTHWAAEKVRDIRSISNVISIGDSWDRASDDLISYAIDRGWCKNPAEFNFSQCYSDFLYTTFSDGRNRLQRTDDLLRRNSGQIDIPFAMRMLRDHGAESGDDWQPGRGLTGAEVCMHASFGPVRVSQTTGSMISYLKGERAAHWVTGTAAPCTSVYKPVWLDAGLPDLGPAPEGTYDKTTLWWRHENLHREILRDYALRIKTIIAERNAMETEFIADSRETMDLSADERFELTRMCFNKADLAESQWLAQVSGLSIQHRRPILDKMAWRKFDREAERVLKFLCRKGRY
jgi:dipeptidase